MSQTPSSPSPDQASLSELVQQLTRQSTELAQKEIELAKAEMTQKGKRLGLGAGAFSGAGLIAPLASRGRLSWRTAPKIGDPSQ